MADAVVEHRYSHSAGRASALKAYFVERNRLFVAVKNFPVPMLVKAILVSVARYAWHLVYMLQGRGKAAEFADGAAGLRLAWFVVRAHWATLTSLPTLLQKRRTVQSKARIGCGRIHIDTPASLDHGPAGGCALTLTPGRNRLLILVPCFNEQGAIATVIKDVHRLLPDTPVLVIDDSSADGTVAVAKAAGAHVWNCLIT